MDKLYADIGKKIKGLAKWSFIVEAIGTVIVGFILLLDEFFVLGLLLMFLGPIVAFVMSWCLYAFGEITDKLCDIERNTKFTYNDEARQEYETNQIAMQEALAKAKAEAEEQRQEAARLRQEKVEQLKEKVGQIKEKIEEQKEKIGEKIEEKNEAKIQREFANDSRKKGEILVVKANKFGDVICPHCNTNLYFEGNAVGVVKCSKCKCSLKIEK